MKMGSTVPNKLPILAFWSAVYLSAVDSASDCRSRGRKFDTQLYNFRETDNEILSTVFPSLSLIQEEQLSVTGKSMRTSPG